jgi:predicted lipoprotein with Yx(FWY)xxD motif
MGILGVALLAAGRLYAPVHRAVPAASQVPLATPLGITLQVRAGKEPVSGAAPEQVYGDASGMTLYVYDKDIHPGTSACDAACTRTWRPAVAPSTAVPEGDWSLIERPDGARQWAYRGAPLYRYADDQVIGDTKGDGVDDAWHAAVFHPGLGLALPDGITARELDDAGGIGLVDYRGKALYVAADADTREPPCDTGTECVGVWEPLEAPAIANPSPDFAVLARNDGITQWTFRGRPLFTFAGDQQPGDASSVGRFHVVLVARFYLPADATIRRTADLGPILATTGGATLYQRDRVTTEERHVFHADHGAPALGRAFGTATCDASCTQRWPPFLAPADARATGYWDVLRRPDGSRQWAYKGFALYRYAPDAPGDVGGNGIYTLAQISNDAAPEPADSEHRPPPGGWVAGVDAGAPIVGSTPGLGVGALFWHAVVP